MAQSEEGLLRALLRDTTFYLCFILLVTTIGPFQFGYHLAELNTPQAVITCEKKSVRNIKTEALESRLTTCIPMSTDQFAVVSSIYTLGGLLGALAAGPCCNKYGRLLTMRAMTLFFTVGPIFEALAASIGVICAGRLLSGIGAGAAVVVVPIYISEVAPPKEKGLFGALTQIMINVGIFVAQLLGYFLSRGNLWRIILAVSGVIGLLQFLALWLVPESPKWLAEHKNPERARQFLRKIRGRRADLDEEVKCWNVDSSNEDIAEEEALLHADPGTHPVPTPKAATSSVGIFSAFMHPTYRPAIIAVVAVMIAQQLTGINSIIIYSVSVLSALLPSSAAFLTVMISVFNIIVTTACAPLSDKLGRKTCILLSIAGMGISSILLATGMSNDIKPLAAVASFLFVASFGFGLGPIPFILANELVGPEAVGATQSWALASNWAATFIVAQFFPILNKQLGEKGRVYYVFAALALVLGGFIAWWVPETKGKKGADEVWGRKEARERVE